MRALLLIAIVSTGCVTTIPLSNDEKCASRGMILEGVTVGESEGSAVSYDWKTSSTHTASYSGTREDVSCTVPKTAVDQCVVRTLGGSVSVKEDFNKTVNGKRTLTGFAYVLYVVPGLILNAAFDSERSDRVAEAKKAAAEIMTCAGEVAH